MDIAYHRGDSPQNEMRNMEENLNELCFEYLNECNKDEIYWKNKEQTVKK